MKDQTACRMLTATVICMASGECQMLVAGLDYSGDQKTSTKFLGVVIGTQEAVDLAVKRLGPGPTHMRKIRNRKRRDEIFSKLHFDGKTAVAFCIQSDIDSLMKKIREKSKRRDSKKDIMDEHDHHLYQQCILKNITTFLAEHGCDARDVVYQYDNDCINFVKANHLTGSIRDGAHRLADMVAWFNHVKKEPVGVKIVDLRDMLNAKLAERFM